LWSTALAVKKLHNSRSVKSSTLWFIIRKDSCKTKEELTCERTQRSEASMQRVCFAAGMFKGALAKGSGKK
jgi:hypothetical protein